ncbi:indolepyruvate ferredoxin oxidoreductase subunit alpha [Christensenellaceae bacterium NSJ-53]|uniref:Indolepyruvate oxidoreductase subunit IorA n=2 Tax=Gehongia tenuis TaxID=2763655 RepID=A0A926D3J2_9FIRM|nr:indolepyruvate ferredoxin oxidoreductase subunit alpha [Gehongia tenuis]
MLGNEAVARGVYEAGATVVASYPGTPSTEITEYAAKYKEIDAEWAPNEKVAMEVAMGASVGGARVMTAMKHVGMNVAADPLFTASYTGVNGGMLICVADDPGMHSSQNEQDSRHYAKGAKLPMVEPADSAECRDMAKAAFELSETYDVPVLLRLTTRIAHSQSLVEEAAREPYVLRPYEKNIGKYVMMPGMAKVRHVVVEERQQKLAEYAEKTALNRLEMNGTKIGVIASGAAYQYAKEALGDRASYLKLGLVYPLPERLIRDFAGSVETLYVIEELDPFIEEHVRALGIDCIGKAAGTLLGESSPGQIRKIVLGEETDTPYSADQSAPGRPPVLCPGCPHRGVYYMLDKLKLTVTGDIGCYTLGAMPPHGAIDTCLCMGGSIGMNFGLEKARGKEFARHTVSVIGDSTFLHSGMTGLLDMVYNGATSTVLILDNSITAMTGHQQNPATGKTLKGDPAPAADLEAICRAVGVKRVRHVSPFDIPALEHALREELAAEEVSVILVEAPCALLPGVDYGAPMTASADCRSCRLCMKAGCPALSMGEDGKVQIDPVLCNGCGFCAGLCPFGVLRKGEKK